MGTGIERSLALLAKTGNEAAVDLLIAALESSDRGVQEGALAALLRRGNSMDLRPLVARWDRLPERWQTALAAAPRGITKVIEDVLLDPDDEFSRNAREAALSTRTFGVIPTLVRVMLEPDQPRSSVAATTLLTLAEMLADALDSPRDHRDRQDPQLMRRKVLPSVAAAADRFDSHRNCELLETFLLITTRDHEVLKKLLASPQLSAYETMVEVLSSSPRAGILRFLIRSLDEAVTSSTVLQVIAQRRDVPFLRQLVRKAAEDRGETVRRNLQRIERMPWLREDLSVLDAFNDVEQANLLNFLWLTGIDREVVERVTAHLMQSGNRGGQAAAKTALKRLANWRLGDDDPFADLQSLIEDELQGTDDEPAARTKEIF